MSHGNRRFFLYISLCFGKYKKKKNQNIDESDTDDENCDKSYLDESVMRSYHSGSIRIVQTLRNCFTYVIIESRSNVFDDRKFFLVNKSDVYRFIKQIKRKHFCCFLVYYFWRIIADFIFIFLTNRFRAWQC